MTAERLRRIEALFHAAREASAEERAALLADADPELRREVESLLAPRGGDVLDRPAMQNAERPTDGSDSVGLTVSAFLGRYRIEGRLGEGGMGEVFRATDTRLGRAVAIKTTRAQFSDRFEREARAISSLNHPHICTLYDVGPNYLVMELVEGETIAARLRRGPLPVKTALQYACQIVAALAEAHGKGIVHRDLKPANIMIARSGIKVLDFGVAKSDQDDTMTASRMIIGTPAYMAPEQWQGKPADARSDIYAFGCVFYEMLTGTRAGSPRPRLPSRTLEAVVRRCLEEDPLRRWQSTHELEPRLAALAAASRGSRIAAAAGARRAPRSPVHRVEVSDKITVVLADLANGTGDAEFDGTLGQLLAGQLEDSARVILLPAPRVQQALSLMDRPADTKLTLDVAAEVCERTASAGVVQGSIVSLGSEYVLSVRARDCRTGAILHKEQAPAPAKDVVFKVMGQLAERFATGLAVSLPRVEKEPSLPVEATTSSLDAWRSYSAAMKVIQSRAQSPESVSLLKRAIEIDPAFAMAHAALGRQLSDLGDTELGAHSIARAYELRTRVSDRENFYITFGYHRQVTRNLELARQTLESWAHTYPSDLYPHGFLSGFVSPGVGQYDRAIEEGLRAIDLDPDFAIGYQNVGWAYVYLNRLADVDALLRRASERKIEVFQFSLIRYAVAFLRGDDAAMEQESTRRQATLHAQGWFEHQEALTAAFRGRLTDATRLSERAVLLARQGGMPERAALFLGARAVWQTFFGMRAEGQQSAVTALALSRSRDADYGPALALALLEESARAREIQMDLEERYPQDTSVQFSYLPTLRALEALNLGDPAKALEMTQVAAPYDLALPGTAYFTGPFFGAQYPVYVRGLAYARLGRPFEAAATFQRILAHPGLVLSDPIGPAARLQLARASSASGDRAISAAAYQGLLALWKGADSDIPLIRQARTEYARLA